MQLGMIGLGRMGASMARRLIRARHELVVHDRQADAVQALVADGAIGSIMLKDFVARLAKPRAVWLMVPAATVEAVLKDLVPLLERGDIVVDGGNSHYHDDVVRAAEFAQRGLHYVDVGVSGGVWGLERGYCLMIGGDAATVAHLDPVFAALAPGAAAADRSGASCGAPSPAEKGYLHCGPSGAGHFVKMVHNGIEYGLMAAYAEGFNILNRAGVGRSKDVADAETAPLRHPEHYRFQIDVPQVAELWRRGSVIGSWLLDLTASVLSKDPELSKFAGRVSDSGEGRWTLQAAIDQGVPAPVLAAALFARFTSRGHNDYASKLLSALRHEFGGHHEMPDLPGSGGR